MKSGSNPLNQILSGKRIFHTSPGYGPGLITQAYLSDSSDIHVIIQFDNCRQANPFSLIKCMKRGLLVLEDPAFNEETLNQIIVSEKNYLHAAMLEEDKRQLEEFERIAMENKRREEERLAALPREQEIQRREAERRNSERLASEKEESERQALEKKQIFHYLTEERSVNFFVHFTPVSNLPSILLHGIMPRSVLSERGIHADTPDEQRFDFRMDYSSFSISFPNYRIFYSKRINTPFTYAVLIIDPQIVLDLPLRSISYLPDNAASSSIRNVEGYTGLDAVKSLFLDSVQVGNESFTREQLGLQDCYPTNPQAEVFIRSIVDPKYIRSIIAEDAEQAKQIKETMINSSEYMPKIFHNRGFYKYREDWRIWRPQTDAPEE